MFPLWWQQLCQGRKFLTTQRTSLKERTASFTSTQNKVKTKALEEELTTAYELAGTKFNHNKIVKIIKFLTNKRMVVQESRGIYRFMPDYHY